MLKKYAVAIAEGIAILGLACGLFVSGNDKQKQIEQKESEIQELQVELKQAKGEESTEAVTETQDETAQDTEGTSEAVTEEKKAEETSEAATEEKKAEETSEAVTGEKKEEVSEAATEDETAKEEAGAEEKKTAEATKSEEKDQELAEKESELAAKDSELAAKDSELAAKEEEFAEKEAKYQEQAAKLQEELTKLLTVREVIVDDLKKNFQDTDLAIDVDEKTGVITIDANVLFDFDSSDLTNEGMKLLDEVIPRYYSVVFNDDVKDYVSEVIVEGHTDTQGTYLYNLFMSQKRAFNVVHYCMAEEGNMLGDERVEEFGKILTANGKSYTNPILSENGEVDDEASRRVEIKFRLISDELLTEMAE